MKELSIIIVTYKGWEMLGKCLESLQVFSGTSFSYEVIIVDNTPDPLEMNPIKEKFPGFLYFHNPLNGGYGYGTNIGSRKASGEFLLVLNPDTIVTETSIGSLLNKTRGKGFMISTCRQVNRRGKESVITGEFPAFGNLTGFMRAFQSRKNERQLGEVLLPDWVSGSLILIRRDDFERLNGFDEDFWMYYEDVDLCKRARDAGGEVAVFTDVTIEHNHGGSSRINQKVTSITKTEVLISRHLYMSKHTRGAARVFIELFMVANNLITNLITAIPGLILFFIPKLFVRTLIFVNLLKYYFGAFLNLTWVSPRSVNYRKYA